jgi:UDP-GlcNAc:undecaprenyl-phosphate GlcNAc-1-phosphate transferase
VDSDERRGVVTNLVQLFEVIFIASIIALLLGIPMRRLSLRLGLVDYPGAASHKTHHNPTPLSGGLVLPFSLVLPLLILNRRIGNESLVILGGMLGMTILGVIDDRYDLKPVLKLAGQVLVTGLFLAGGIQVHITQVPAVDIMLSTLWLVGMTNAFNFVDSMDGLAVGLAGISAAFFMLVTIDSSQPALALLSAAILGSCAGLFFFNVTPAQLFLGDSGAQALGVTLAAVAIAYTPGQAGLPQALTWFIPILVLGVPIFDMVLVIVSRLRAHLRVYLARQDHVYHRLVGLGLDSTRAVAAMQLCAILLGLLGFISLELTTLQANLLFGATIIAGIILIVVLEKMLDGEQTES